jgi:hypothetical protein
VGKWTRAEMRARRKQVTVKGPMPVIPSPVGIGRFGGSYAEAAVEHWKEKMRTMAPWVAW